MTKDIYTEHEEMLNKEIDEMIGNPAINKLVYSKLPNSSEATDFDLWADCTEQAVRDHLPILREWELM